MANSTSGPGCRTRCWQIAAVIGVVALILMLVIGNQGLFAAIVMSVILAVILGVGLGYFFCREAPGTATGQETTPKPAAAGAPQPDETERDAAPEPEPQPDPSEPAGPPPAAAEEGSPVRYGTQLPGEQELAARKGEWTYGGGAGADGTAGAAAAASASGGGGTRPEGLSQAREGRPDDLKRIKGIGPKLEQLLHSMGYYHYDQIAAWGPEEVAWVDENLKGFKGRVSRDNWVEQARILAGGGETEFSKRVGDGDVY